MIINLIVIIISLCVCISKHHVHLKYIQFLFEHTHTQKMNGLASIRAILVKISFPHLTSHVVERREPNIDSVLGPQCWGYDNDKCKQEDAFTKFAAGLANLNVPGSHEGNLSDVQNPWNESMVVLPCDLNKIVHYQLGLICLQIAKPNSSGLSKIQNQLAHVSIRLEASGMATSRSTELSLCIFWPHFPGCQFQSQTGSPFVVVD